MDTPEKALNVARLASWISFGTAASSAFVVMKWVKAWGLGVVLTARPAGIVMALLVVGIVVGGRADVRPAGWSIALVWGCLGLDAACRILNHGTAGALVLDALGVVLAMMSFRGVRRLAELRS